MKTNIKAVITMISLAVILFALYAFYTQPATFEVVKREGTVGAVTWDVTYQAKNVFGIEIGEEYTVTELTPYWKEIWTTGYFELINR